MQGCVRLNAAVRALRVPVCCSSLLLGVWSFCSRRAPCQRLQGRVGRGRVIQTGIAAWTAYACRWATGEADTFVFSGVGLLGRAQPGRIGSGLGCAANSWPHGPLVPWVTGSDRGNCSQASWSQTVAAEQTTQPGWGGAAASGQQGMRASSCYVPAQVCGRNEVPRVGAAAGGLRCGVCVRAQAEPGRRVRDRACPLPPTPCPHPPSPDKSRVTVNAACRCTSSCGRRGRLSSVPPPAPRAAQRGVDACLAGVQFFLHPSGKIPDWHDAVEKAIFGFNQASEDALATLTQGRRLLDEPASSETVNPWLCAALHHLQCPVEPQLGLCALPPPAVPCCVHLGCAPCQHSQSPIVPAGLCPILPPAVPCCVQLACALRTCPNCPNALVRPKASPNLL